MSNEHTVRIVWGERNLAHSTCVELYSDGIRGYWREVLIPKMVKT